MRNKSLVAFLLLLLSLSLAGNMRSQVNGASSVVYYKDDGTNIDVYNPNLYVRIVKTWAPWRQAGRITIIQYKGGSNLVASAHTDFGNIKVWNPTNGTTKNKSPSDLAVNSATGNNTGKLTITLKATSIIDHDTGANSMSVNVWVKYIMYADFDAVFIYVKIDSSITSWLEKDTDYGTAMRFKPLTSYNATGINLLDFKTGSLTKSGNYVIMTDVRYNTITVKNSEVAITLVPLTITSTAGSVLDATTYTRVSNTKLRARTFSQFWYGSYMKNIKYGCAWLFNDPNTSPYIITPWVMPNAVPYGIMHTYDEMPAYGEYDKISPSNDTPRTSAWFYWLDENPKRRVNLLFTMNYRVDDYTPNPNGVDQSWTWDGSTPLYNTSSSYKMWLQNLENKRMGFGIHAYHHDSPWQWEFSVVTNKTWLDKTWERLYADFLAVGLTNNSLCHWKPAGFHAEGPVLEVLPKYGVKFMHWYQLSSGIPVLYSTYTHSDGRVVLLACDGIVPTEDIYWGKSVSDVVNGMKGNISSYGLVALHGHISRLDQNYADVNSVFTQVESYFGDNLDYFLVHEIANYWYDVLLPLEFTYNTTNIEKSTNDPRLTFKMLNPPYSITEGLVYKSTSFTLYAPNINTGTFKFTKFCGYATLSDLVQTSYKLTFTVSAPSETTSTTKVFCDEPTRVCATNGTLTWSYNASTKILTLNVVHASPVSILVDWRIAGDVNGDGKVDVSDLFDSSASYGSDRSKPNWNPDCDFNWDGKIDASDLFDLSKNYGYS